MVVFPYLTRKFSRRKLTKGIIAKSIHQQSNAGRSRSLMAVPFASRWIA
jgi:hypothetical protein